MMFRFLILAAVATLFTAPASALQLTPSAEVYETSDSVEVVAYNDGVETITFTSSDPYSLTNLTTAEVFSVLSLPIVFDVAPGGSETFTVPGDFLTPGHYSMEFEYFTPPFEPANETTYFEVVAKVDAGPGSFGQAKSRYAPREE